MHFMDLLLTSTKVFARVFFFFKIFLMWTILKIFIEFVTILLLFCVLLFCAQGMWDLSSLMRV